MHDLCVYFTKSLTRGSEGHVALSPKCARPRCLCTTVIVAIAQTPTATHATSSCVRVNLRGRRCSPSSATPRSMESYAFIVATRRRMTRSVDADAIVTGKGQGLESDIHASLFTYIRIINLRRPEHAQVIRAVHGLLWCDRSIV